MERRVTTRKRPLRSLLFVFAALLLLGAGAMAAINLHMIASVRDRILTSEQAAALDVDCILVLGAGLRGDGSPSTILADRLDYAIALYEGGVSDRLLMSGDHSSADYDEVGAMRDYVVERGVDADHVFLDHAGFSTYESIYRAGQIFGAETVVIVTQSYHLYRALYLAWQLGLTAYGVASDARAYARQPLYTAREIMARCKDYLFALCRPEPTYLGTAIPLSGSGRVTHRLPAMPLA